MDDHPTQLSQYGSILLMGIIGALLVCATITLAKIISPKKPNLIKNSTYECGEETVGTSWGQFNPRFYVIALIFLLFDVELIFVFPWATVFGNREFIAADPRWGWFTLVEMAIFLGILILGLVYVWRRGDLNWIQTTHIRPQTAVKIPASAYDKLNKTTYQVRDFSIVEKPQETSPKSEDKAKQSSGFKPRFKNPNA